MRMRFAFARSVPTPLDAAELGVADDRVDEPADAVDLAHDLVADVDVDDALGRAGRGSRRPATSVMNAAQVLDQERRCRRPGRGVLPLLRDAGR